MDRTTHHRHGAAGRTGDLNEALLRVSAPVRRRWRRLRADLVDAAKLAVLGALLLGFAGLAVLSGGYLLVGSGIEALAQWMPHWLATLTCALVLLLTSAVSAGLGLLAMSRIRRR